MSTYLAFVVAATALAVTPGPGVAFVVARTVAGGRAEGLAARLGTGLGGFGGHDDRFGVVPCGGKARGLTRPSARSAADGRRWAYFLPASR